MAPLTYTSYTLNVVVALALTVRTSPHSFTRCTDHASRSRTHCTCYFFHDVVFKLYFRLRSIRRNIGNKLELRFIKR